jgi:hypothetical protein
MRFREFNEETSLIDKVFGGANMPSDAMPKLSKDSPSTGSSSSLPVDPNAKGQATKDGAVIIGKEKRSGGTISWRTNNPGNVMYGDFAKSHGAIGFAKSGDGEPVAIMPTLDHGIKMQMSLWRRSMYNNKTIDLGSQQWATANKGKRGTPYARDLAQAAGASIDTKVADLSDDQLKRMVTAQMRWEGFKPGTITTV